MEVAILTVVLCAVARRACTLHEFLSECQVRSPERMRRMFRRHGVSVRASREVWCEEGVLGLARYLEGTLLGEDGRLSEVGVCIRGDG